MDKTQALSLDLMLHFLRGNSHRELQLYLALRLKAGGNGGRWHRSGNFTYDLCQLLKIKKSAFYNRLRRLKAMGLVYKAQDGCYYFASQRRALDLLDLKSRTFTKIQEEYVFCDADTFKSFCNDFFVASVLRRNNRRAKRKAEGYCLRDKSRVKKNPLETQEDVFSYSDSQGACPLQYISNGTGMSLTEAFRMRRKSKLVKATPRFSKVFDSAEIHNFDYKSLRENKASLFVEGKFFPAERIVYDRSKGKFRYRISDNLTSYIPVYTISSKYSLSSIKSNSATLYIENGRKHN